MRAYLYGTTGNVRFTSVNTFGSVLEGVGRLDFERAAFEIPMGTPGMIGQVRYFWQLCCPCFYPLGTLVVLLYALYTHTHTHTHTQYVRFAGPNSGEHLVANFECSLNLDNVSVFFLSFSFSLIFPLNLDNTHSCTHSLTHTHTHTHTHTRPQTLANASTHTPINTHTHLNTHTHTHTHTHTQVEKLEFV
jgi:hypothetical protein